MADEIKLECVQDYMQLIPYELSEPFTVSEFAKTVKIKKNDAGTVLHILNYLGVIKHCGKRGRAYLYCVND